jgi:hypothetical protein
MGTPREFQRPPKRRAPSPENASAAWGARQSRQTFIGYIRSASGINAVGDAAQNVFHLAHTRIGIHLVQRTPAAQHAIGRL